MLLMVLGLGEAVLILNLPDDPCHHHHLSSALFKKTSVNLMDH